MNGETPRSAPSSGRRFARFIEPAAVTPQRVLVARIGVEDGCGAAVEASAWAWAWAWAHRAEMEGMSNPLAICSAGSGLLAGLDEPTFVGEDDKLGAVAHPELHHGAVDVGLDGER